MEKKEYIERGAFDTELQNLVREYNRNCESDKASGAFEALYRLRLLITCGWYTEAHGLAYNKGFETESGFMWLATASHWMPLPEPPAEYSDCELEGRKNE